MRPRAQAGFTVIELAVVLAILAILVMVIVFAVDGSSGTTTVDTGSVTVSETGADLDGYDSAIACTAGGTPIAYGFGASLDIMADGSNGAGKTCDGISIGLGFEGASTTLGPVGMPAEPQPPACAETGSSSSGSGSSSSSGSGSSSSGN